MSIFKIAYYVARTWFDFNILLPTWFVLIKADEFLTGSCRHVVPYDDAPVNEQEP